MSPKHWTGGQVLRVIQRPRVDIGDISGIFTYITASRASARTAKSVSILSKALIYQGQPIPTRERSPEISLFDVSLSVRFRRSGRLITRFQVTTALFTSNTTSIHISI